ncbi:MAG: endonuclease III [Caldiserica bacterium]|nr:MAG: endonuclease III [Caldisericota bacterium]
MQKRVTDTVQRIIETLKKEKGKFKKTAISEIQETKDPFRVLISCLLSLRTKDGVTLKASKRLFLVAKTPEEFLNLSTKKIEELIYPVGFYRVKAKRIKEISKILIERFGGKVPDNLEELLTLPGVGRKTANIVITQGFNKYGIAVDTHVHRVSNRLGLVKTKTPEETEMELRKIIPKKYWIEFNDLFVSFGQNICTPISPKCSICPISKYCNKVGIKTHR